LEENLENFQMAAAASVLAASKAEVNENFIKACRDGDLALFNSLLGSADVNHVSESLHGIKFVFSTRSTRDLFLTSCCW